MKKKVKKILKLFEYKNKKILKLFEYKKFNYEDGSG